VSICSPPRRWATVTPRPQLITFNARVAGASASLIRQRRAARQSVHGLIPDEMDSDLSTPPGILVDDPANR
jgi:hypothetical protein